MSRAELAEHRPDRGVRITRVDARDGAWQYVAACGACDWAHVSNIRAVVEESSGIHRHNHRAAAPGAAGS